MLTHAPQTTQGQAGQPSFFYPENSTTQGLSGSWTSTPSPPPTSQRAKEVFRKGRHPVFALPGPAEKKNKGKLKQAQELLFGNCWRWGVTVFMEERAAFCFPLYL